MEVFSECVRYANLMQVVLDGFYAKDGKKTLRSEQNLYTGKLYRINKAVTKQSRKTELLIKSVNLNQ